MPLLAIGFCLRLLYPHFYSPWTDNKPVNGSPEHFNLPFCYYMQPPALKTSHLAKFIAWGTITVLIYHLVGGIRHLIMDMGHWEELKSGNLSAKVAIAIWIVLAVLAGVWLWF